MARQLRPVGLDFADTAPLRLSFTADVGATPAAVYAALAEDVESWPSWFTSLTEVARTNGGKGRDVRLRGGVLFNETIMSERPLERYAYRIDVTNTPGVRAMLEDWGLTPSPSGGARVRWTMAVDGASAFRAVLRLLRPGLGRAFRDAMRRLDRRLAPAA